MSHAGGKLRDFVIKVLDEFVDHICAVVKDDWVKGTKLIPCMPDAKGHSVKISRTENRPLQICEVQVFGTQGN